MKHKVSFFRFFGLLIILLISSLQSFAQISEGGLPPSFTHSSLKKQTQSPFVAPIDFDVNQLKQQDAKDESYGHPPRVATIIPVDLTMDNAGEWTPLPSGEQMWQLSIQAPNAIALMLYYDEFYIPEGGKLFIYNKEKTHLLGAYTENTNPWNKAFSTEFVAGDELTLEYIAPTNQPTNKARIKISGISYGYNHLEVYTRSKQKINNSLTCHVNINCSEGTSWQNQKKGVVRIIIRNGASASACTGSIINNTGNDLIPYMLSANHCFGGATEDTYLTMTFYFHYEYSGCENESTEPYSKTLIGAEPMVLIPMSGHSDGALLKLTTTIPNDYDVYWNGWNIENAVPQSGAGIHHPAGDVKKISTYNSPAAFTQATVGSDVGNAAGHMKVVYNATTHGYGIVEAGSSGSPLFNEQGLVVGTLTGGSVTCSAPLGDIVYGRLWYHWNQAGTTAEMQMKTYLDPGNTGAQSLGGRYISNAVIADFTSDKQTVYTTEAIQFIDQSTGANKYEWAFAGGTPATSTVRNPKITYNTAGTYNVTLTIDKGEATEQVVSKTIKCIEKKNPCPDPIIVVGTGIEVSQFPLGALNNNVFSSSIYTNAELGNTNKPITQLAWRANTYAYSSYVSIQVYLKEVDATTQTSATWADEIQDATLVYSSPTASTNLLNWNTITLTEPFLYSGTKNLKVMVYARKASGSNTSTRCRYTTATNAHMQWVSSTTGSSTLGTVDNNRPNITVTFDEGCAISAPVSNFSIRQYEGFDAIAFPPKGWKIVIKGESHRIWEKGEYPAVPFSKIDATNSKSAFFTEDTTGKEIDTWITSKYYRIADDSKIDFYLGYNGKYLSRGCINFYISTDKGETWGTPVLTTGNTDDPASSWDWRKETFDLSAYSGRDICFAWQFKGSNNAMSALDGISVYSPSNKMNIYENETVRLIDLSTGPAETWAWTLPGGSVTTSSLQNPYVKYAAKGEHNITLATTNRKGANVTTKTIPLTVIGIEPVADFLIMGVNRYPECDIFLPVDAPIAMCYDLTTNTPTSWDWTFNGSTTNPTSTRQNPIISYPITEGNYSVRLKATNAAGSNEITKTNYVTVGTKSWVWNIRSGESGDHVLRYANGFVTGSNNFSGIGSHVFVETFDVMDPVEITKLRIAFHLEPSAEGFLLLNMCADDGNGQPIVLRDAIEIAVADINPNDYTEITLPKPYGASGIFHVVIRSLGTPGSAKGVAIKSSPIRPYGHGTTLFMNGNVNNTAFLPLGTTFGYDLSLNILAELNYSKIGTKTSEMLFKDVDIEKNLDVTANCHWEATTSAPWITITNAIGSGEDEVGIKCIDNTSAPRIGNIILTGGGQTYTIVVKQAGANMSTELTAQIDPNNNRNVKLQWTKKTYYTADIYEDFESHPDFLNASPGTLGWSYVDVDKNSTQCTLGNYGFPGDTNVYPHTFLIFNRSRMQNMTTKAYGLPASSFYYNALEAHSGAKMLASMGPYYGGETTNDWIMSPLLSFGQDFKLSFWAEGVGEACYMRVLYSTTGADIADFTTVVTSPVLTKVAKHTWTLYEFTIPKTARYIAINHIVSSDIMTYALCIDDIFIGVGNRPAGTSVTAENSQYWPVISTAEPVMEDHQTTAFPQSKEYSKPQFSVEKAPKQSKEKSIKAGLDEVGKKLRWDNGLIQFYTGNSTTGRMEAGAKWTAAELAPYNGLRIAQVSIGVGQNAQFAVKIYQGGVLIFSQSMENVQEFSFNSLSTEVIIDASKDLIVSYTVNHATSIKPVGLDKGPAQEGKGNLLWDDANNQWSTASILSSGIVIGNWNIAVTLGTPEGMLYKVLRQGVEVGRSSDINFTDENVMIAGGVCYTVNTMFDEGTESLPSNEACVELETIPQTITFDPLEVKKEKGADFTLNATASSQLPVRYTSSDPAVASIHNDRVVKIGKIGSTTITAYQDGNEVYDAALPVGRLLEVISSLESPSQLKAPEGFSPNGDGTNDTFVIEGIEQFVDNTLSVFDVNGKIHFSAKGYNNTWDGVASQGEFKGKKLPVGIYYYILTVNGSPEKRSAVVIKY